MNFTPVFLAQLLQYTQSFADTVDGRYYKLWPSLWMHMNIPEG